MSRHLIMTWLGLFLPPEDPSPVLLCPNLIPEWREEPPPPNRTCPCRQELHQEKTAIFFIPKKVWNRPIMISKITVFQGNSYFIPQNAFYNFLDLFHTLSFYFIPWVSISYLWVLFHTLGIFFIPLVFFHTIRHHFHTFECIFIPSIFHTFGMQFHTKTLQFHTSWWFFSYHRNCNFIPTVVRFTPGTDLFILKVNNSYPGWKFTIKLTYGSSGRHKWHTHTHQQTGAWF
jgi:hypothetical protein